MSRRAEIVLLVIVGLGFLAVVWKISVPLMVRDWRYLFG